MLYEDVRQAQEALHRLHVTLRELAAVAEGGVAGSATAGAGRERAEVRNSTGYLPDSSILLTQTKTKNERNCRNFA